MAEEKKKDRGLWFREMKSELKKVVWPNKQTVAKNTGTVLLCSLLVGACIWIFDFVATQSLLLSCQEASPLMMAETNISSLTKKQHEICEFE